MRRFAIASPTHALWQCGLRPFFIGACVAALATIAPWLLHLALGSPIPGVLPAAQWHALLLLGGMGLAAVAGFLLTAIPEFTTTEGFAPRALQRAAALWAAAITADAIGAVWSLAGALLLWIAFVGWLVALVLPRVWRQPDRPHASFVLGVLALGAGLAAWHVELLLGGPAGRWPDALLSVYMVLMVLALSRISMRIVNDALDDVRRSGDTAYVGPYLARKPRRNLAIALIVAHAAVQAAWPQHAARGWLALAAGAAVLNLLNDWHVGRALLRKWPFMLYTAYAAMAAGYGLLGAGSLLDHAGAYAAGRHVLALAVFGLGIFSVFAIAGRNHIGLALDERAWVPLGAALLVAAAALRGALVWAPETALWLLPASGAAWLGAFALVAWRLLPLWCLPRRDGRRGC